MQTTRVLLLAGFVLVFAMAGPAVSQQPPTTAEKPADTSGERKVPESGVVVAPEPSKALKPAKTVCTLSVSPNPASNGTIVNFAISYSPCKAVPATETFTFKWPSNLLGFREVTTRQKIFQNPGCILSSFDATVVPTALAIKGPMTVTVASRITSNNNLICTASAPLTIP